MESHKDPAYEYTAKDFNDFRQVRAIKTVDILEIEEMIFASLLSFVLPVLNWQKMEEENSKQEAKFLTEREEAKTDEVLKVQKSVKTIFRLLRLGAPPEDISEKRNLIIVGELIDLCMVSWYYLLTVWNIWTHRSNWKWQKYSGELPCWLRIEASYRGGRRGAEPSTWCTGCKNMRWGGSKRWNYIYWSHRQVRDWGMNCLHTCKIVHAWQFISYWV